MVLALLTLLVACTGSPNFTVESWLYQLQNASPVEISRSSFDLVVMDYSNDDGRPYDEKEIGLIKGSGKVVLAYMSVGEAEDYRFYWKDSWKENPPEWLGPENPDWNGNYAVRYWMKDWRDIVIEYLRKVKAQGFDGVYLDKVDEYEYWSDVGEGDEETLASSMVKLIGDISKEAGTMLVFIQNGEMLSDFGVLGIVDGIGVEDLWYDGTEPIDENETSERLRYLRKFRDVGKIVLVVDYVDDGSGYSGKNLERIEDFVFKSRREGFIPYVAREDRELDDIVVIPGIQPPDRSDGR